MNIPDKRQLASEQSRVLRPGGRLAFQELFAGLGGEASASFLVPAEDVRRLLLEYGFAERAWVLLAPNPEPGVSQNAPRPVAAVSVVHGPDTAAMDASGRPGRAG